VKQLDARDASSSSGHLGCPGCGEALSLRLVLEAVGLDAIMVLPACCTSYVNGIWPLAASLIPVLHVATSATAAAAAGIRAALEVRGQLQTTVVAWTGANTTFDAGLSAVSSAAGRNDDILCLCCNNKSYISVTNAHFVDNSGSGPTRRHRRSFTSKDIVEVMASHHIPYCATACIAYPDDLIAKVRRAVSIPGFKFIHLLTPCPAQWDIPSELSIEIARAAVQTRLFPLYEVEDGTKYTINFTPETFVPVQRFLSRQGRFAGLKTETIKRIQSRTEAHWKLLLQKESQSAGADTRLGKPGKLPTQ
jgi:pyruvate/2-oxoacid:ferredoxin oxidoreductase beta subunit